MLLAAQNRRMIAIGSVERSVLLIILLFGCNARQRQCSCGMCTLSKLSLFGMLLVAYGDYMNNLGNLDSINHKPTRTDNKDLGKTA